MKLFFLLTAAGHDLYICTGNTCIYFIFIINHVENISIYQQYVFILTAKKGRFNLLECI